LLSGQFSAPWTLLDRHLEGSAARGIHRFKYQSGSLRKVGKDDPRPWVVAAKAALERADLEPGLSKIPWGPLGAQGAQPPSAADEGLAGHSLAETTTKR